ncbi:MAG: hypothetical protein K6T74_10885 [Geminicoccaceae bacterium]|nr:hypothetical protein [Geminicoccaceae bacterium]
MRRWLSGGVLLSLSLVAGHAAVEAWMEARAVFALEEASRQLPEGSRLAWQRLDARPLRLALDVEGVRLDLPASARVRALEVGTLRLAQAAGGVDSLGRVGSVRAENVTIELADDGGTVRIAAIEGDRVDIDALTAALARPQPWEALGELRLGPLALEDLTFVQGDATLRVPRLAIAGWAERRLEGLALEALEARDGLGSGIGIGALALDRLDLHAADPATLEQLGADPMELLGFVDRLRIDGLRLADLSFGDGAERLDLARLELGRLGQGRLEAFRLERFEVESAEGRGDLALAEIERIDWSRVRLERLVRAGTLLGELAAVAREAAEAAEEDEDGASDEAATDDPAEGTEEQALAGSFAGLEFAAELARLELGTIRVEGLVAGEPAGSGAELDRFRWDGLVERRFGAIELAGLRGRGEDGVELRLERFEQSAVTVAPPDFAERVERAPRTPEALQELTAELARLPWDSRTVLAGLALDKNGLRGFGIERAALALEQQGSKRATRFELTGLLLDPAVMEDEELKGSLAMAGIDRLQLGFRLASVFDEASLEAALDPLELDAPGFLGLRTSVLGKLGADPAVDPVTASTDAVLRRAELRLEDKGLIDRQLREMAEQSRKKRADLAKELVRELRSDEPMRSLLDQKRAGELEKFLAKPRVLVIRLVPPKPVTFMAAFMGMLATPGQAAKTLGLTIEARDS